MIAEIELITTALLPALIVNDKVAAGRYFVPVNGVVTRHVINLKKKRKD